MKTETIRSWADEELNDQVVNARRELFNLKVQKAMRQLDQSLRLRNARRDLARLLTIRHERRRINEAESE